MRVPSVRLGVGRVVGGRRRQVRGRPGAGVGRGRRHGPRAGPRAGTRPSGELRPEGHRSGRHVEPDGVQLTSGVVTPSSGNTYNTSTFVIRSPANNTSLTFGGTSLQIDGGGGQLLGKSNAAAATVAAGTAGVVTFANLIFNGGLVREANAANDGSALALNGIVTVNAPSILSALTGESLYVNSTINGSSGLTFGFNTGGGTTSNYSSVSFNQDQGVGDPHGPTTTTPGRWRSTAAQCRSASAGRPAR